MPDSYRCVVCGDDSALNRVIDESGEFLVCPKHWRLLTSMGVTYKRQLEAMGVLFGDQPMDLNYPDDQFLRDCGIKPVEPWEWSLAKEEANDIQQKRDKPNRKLRGA